MKLIFPKLWFKSSKNDGERRCKIITEEPVSQFNL